MAAWPALLIRAVHLLSTSAEVMAGVSVASPVMIVMFERREAGIRSRSLRSERT